MYTVSGVRELPGNAGLAISFCGKDEKTYWQDIEKLIREQVKVVNDNPFPWKDENPNAKPDLRNKKNPNAAKPKSNSDSNKSRKSDGSKKK